MWGKNNTEKRLKEIERKIEWFDIWFNAIYRVIQSDCKLSKELSKQLEIEFKKRM